MKLYKWFSICSAHLEPREGCKLCDTGHWVFMPTWWLGHIVFKVSPGLWRWWANRGDARKRFKNRYSSKKTGKKVNPFPNM